MKIKILIFVVIFFICPSFGQNVIIESLRTELHGANNDTMRLVLSNRLSWAWLNINSDSSLLYAGRYMNLSHKLDYHLNEADALNLIAFNNIYLGNYPRALETLFKAIKTLDRNNQKRKILPIVYLDKLKVPAHLHSLNKLSLDTEADVYNIFSLLYWINGREEANLYAHKVGVIAKEINSADLLANACLWKGVHGLDKPDSAIYYLLKARNLFVNTDFYWIIGTCDEYVALAFHLKGDHESELKYLRSGIQKHLINYNIRNSGWSYTKFSDYFLEKGIMDSVIYFAHKALTVSVNGNYPDIELKAVEQLANAFKSLNQRDSSYKYLQLWIDVKNSSLNSETTRQFENVQNNQQLQERELVAAHERYQTRMKLFGLLAGITALLIFTLLLMWNNKQKKKANAFLKHKNEEIEIQKNIAEKALSDLKSTQSQLIQSEKMASLGELTAGIAHEIQNPLNFVNNFSEVNTELIAELKDEIDKGNIDEVKVIANDIAANEQKINHHGKRADAIVKGMLQHSRSSSGIKEPTDINALADEYLRLAYHGLRAKDKSFNATMKTDFDETIGKINVIPQDIGRVILNLITNAFYSVTEKKNQQGNDYEPTVSIISKKINGRLELSVKDNGNGIPQKVLDKIYQPFFTTKPSGQGTGLGLSMSYEIVTKGHNGELKVETQEGEGSVFTIILPFNR
jgi:two-component system, NtrC family, sensor kinase